MNLKKKLVLSSLALVFAVGVNFKSEDLKRGAMSMVNGVMQVSEEVSNLESVISKFDNVIGFDRREVEYNNHLGGIRFFKSDLEVVGDAEFYTESDTGVDGVTYFCSTGNHRGYYLFVEDAEFDVGDKVQGWFGRVPTKKYNDAFGVEYSLLIPVYMNRVQ